jgi:SRSO17 transposase
VDLGELSRVRVELQEFCAEAFVSLRRRDQRYWGSVYLRGLMLDGERKSVEPISQRAPEADRQSLQQFLTDSPWDPVPVRAAMARTMAKVIDPEAVVFDDTGFPKCGLESPGVARQYSGTLGKTGNCQVAVTTHLATDHASYPANWRLFLPAKQWDPASHTCPDPAVVTARRSRCKIPEQVRHTEKWRLALDSLDELHTWGVRVPLALADAGYGDCFEFRLGLAQRAMSYVVGVTGTITAHPADARRVTAPWSGRGRRPVPAYPDKPLSLTALAAATGAKAVARRWLWGWRRHRAW